MSNLATIEDHVAMRAIRLILPVAAVILVAWFVVGARQAHEVAVATPIVVAGPSGQHRQLLAAGADLNAAAWLNPDREVEILQGRLAIDEGHIGRARRILRTVTASEPQNLEAWVWLVGASLRDRREAKIGFAHLRVLDPLDIH